MAIKLAEHTYGNHIYMKILMDDMKIEEIDVYFRELYVLYRTSAIPVDVKRHQEIVDAFNELY